MTRSTPPLGCSKAELSTPALCLDLDRFEANVEKMVLACRSHHLQWRPHAKCHKSPVIGNWLVTAGACGLTCATIREAEIMAEAGLERIGPFESEYEDCSRLPVSLNLQAFKPAEAAADMDTTGIYAVLSAPRFGPVMHFRHVGIAFGSLRIPFEVGQGAYWHHVLTQQLDDMLERGGEFLITVDYDSIFGRDDVAELIRLVRAFPDADAVCALQMKRGANFALMGIADKHGKPRSSGHVSEFSRYLTRITTGHFGLTIFRAKALAALPRPWFLGKPTEDGRWGEGAIAPDIAFWHNWKAAGFKLFVAPRVPIGHIEETIKWPDKTLRAFYQEAQDYADHGIPKEVAR